MSAKTAHGTGPAWPALAATSPRAGDRGRDGIWAPRHAGAANTEPLRGEGEA
jgi:hypothetical protein